MDARVPWLRPCISAQCYISLGYNEGMRTYPHILVMLAVLDAGCREAAPPPVTPLTTPRIHQPLHKVAGALSTPSRCLPVVSQECGCVYKCGVGVQVGNGSTWNVSHGFWPGMAITARVAEWCVAGSCTDAFAAELICAGICAPKPADATCFFDAQGACVGATI